MDYDRLPYCEAVEQRRVGNFYLTGSRWHNELGSDQPETGIRDIQHPTRFILCQHFGVRNTCEALDEIQWRLEAGWCPYETSDAVERINDPDFEPDLI